MTATRHRGRIDAGQCSQRGGWIIANHCRWYFLWTSAPGVQRGIADVRVEFSLTHDDCGRAVAVDVLPIRG
jgi:hypothetical protein